MKEFIGTLVMGLIIGAVGIWAAISGSRDARRKQAQSRPTAASR